ncbi:hypothetical protein ACFYQ5_30555 [Streptomyces sp. NPDC005794]|uniref:hypothetical protein n=1 Tax=Streptomyces sp. NPDC005794 TaxID=3364733 RepID=UPI0036B0888A
MPSVRFDSRPDLTRSGVGIVKVSTWDAGTPDRQLGTVCSTTPSGRPRRRTSPRSHPTVKASEPRRPSGSGVQSHPGMTGGGVHHYSPAFSLAAGL